MKVEFFRHSLGEEEIRAATDTLRSTFLTTGAKNEDFEARFASYLGVGHAVTTSSATAGLHLSLLALGVGPGDEVITTPMSFVATSNAVLMAGAIPVFVDVEPATGLIDPGLVEAAVTPQTKAILPVHLYGQMADMRALGKIARDRDLFVIEDSAHAIEAERDGLRPGQAGDAAVFSFYATKNITCGEGGAVVTRHPHVAKTLGSLRNHGMSRSATERYTGPYEHWDVDRLGWKYNLTNFQAAMLIPQLQKIEDSWVRRDEIARRYEEAFAGAGMAFPVARGERNRSARHLATIWTEIERRDEHLALLQAAGIGVAVNYRPIHLLAFYRETFGYAPGDFPIAESIGSRTLSLPLYPSLTDEEVEYVTEQVLEIVGGGKRRRFPAGE